MAENSKELKPQNVPRLSLFFGLNVAVLFIVASGQGSTFTLEQFIKTIGSMQNGAVVLMTSLAVIVLDGLVPNVVKDVLVFWRWPHPLPGCRAFTTFAQKFPHLINIEALKKRVKPWPTKNQPDKQNKHWLDLAIKQQAEPAVSQAHRNFLLTKEMTSLSALFLILFPAMLCATEATTTRTIAIYAGALAAQWFLIALASRNYGNNFVIIVLTRASSTH